MFSSLAQTVINKLTDYLKESRSGKINVLNQISPEKIADELQLIKYISEGGLHSETAKSWLDSYLKHTQHMHHPHYMGHQVSVPHPASAIADLIHGLVNNPMAIYEMGPAAATIEKVMINWMLQKIGWFHGKDLKETDNEKIKGGGILTHGGSLANLTALLAARSKADPNAWSKGVSKDLVILCPEVSHYSIARSISIMGMGSDSVIPVKVDKNEVLLTDDLSIKYKSVIENNKKVMAVIANACATSTGLYDPLVEVASFCKEHNLWFHVDGAHGAGALLSEKEKHLMGGIYLADSMIWDAHKMLRTSTLCAAALFKDYRNLDNTFRQKGSYIYFDKEQVGFDQISNALECTKAGIGTKLFWVLASEGESGITKYIESRYDLANEIYELITLKQDFECPYKPESNILCFIYTKFGYDNDFQLSIRNELIKRGNFYITSAVVNNQRCLRLSLMNPDTDSDHIKKLLAEIEVVGAELNNRV